MQDMMKKFEKPLEMKEGDYYKEDILYCGKCNTPKSVKSLYSGKVIPALCECEQKKYVEKEENQKHEDFLLKYQNYVYDSYKGVKFENINLDCGENYDFAKRYVDNFEKCRKDNIGLYIYGDFGNGKTTITKAIANELMEREYIVCMYPCNIAIDKFNDYPDFKAKVRDCDLLILDDFGSNRMTDYQIERLQNLIDYRYEIKKPLIVTTNVNRKNLASTDLPSNLQRIYDRVIEMTFGVEIKVNGKRKELARDKMNEYKDLLLGGKK